MRKSPKDIVDSARIISRRGVMLGVLQAAVIGTLGLRLRSMQIEHADEFRLLSDGNSIKIRLLPPVRELIHDRNGVVIAGNEQNYRATITRELAGNVDEVIAKLRHLVPMSDAEAAEILHGIGRAGRQDLDHARTSLTMKRMRSPARSAAGGSRIGSNSR